MFNIGFGEILIVLVVAFVIVGPDDLPRVARWLGRSLRKLRLLMRDIKRETGWDEIEKEVRGVERDVKQTVREMDISADLKDAAKSVEQEIKGVSRDVERDIKAFDKDMKSEVAAMDADIREATARKEEEASNIKEENQNETGNH